MQESFKHDPEVQVLLATDAAWWLDYKQIRSKPRSAITSLAKAGSISKSMAYYDRACFRLR